KLIRRGDFHVGAQVKTMLSLPKKELTRREHSIDHGIPVMEEETSGHKQLCLCGTLDGSIGMITPIPEKMYKRMQLLHSQMVNGIQHPAGLNPKSFRLMQSKQRLAINPAKGILDGDLLIQFPNLALHRQREMTKQIGTTVERILDD
ncbi:25619_t:CDS:2, partial [Racocetra persica]